VLPFVVWEKTGLPKESTVEVVDVEYVEKASVRVTELLV
jgi:hypothetical protein